MIVLHLSRWLQLEVVLGHDAKSVSAALLAAHVLAHAVQILQRKRQVRCNLAEGVAKEVAALTILIVAEEAVVLLNAYL